MKDYLGWFVAGVVTGVTVYMSELFRRHECPECQEPHIGTYVTASYPFDTTTVFDTTTGGDPWQS